MEINKIYNENCLDTMSRMQDKCIDLIVTSPPYFNAKEYSQYNSVTEYMRQMKDIFLETERVMKEGRMCVVNISPILVAREKRSKQSYRIPLPYYFVPMMEELGFEFLEDIIWEKPEGAAANRNGGFFRSRKPLAYKPNIVTEYILVFKKKSNLLIDKYLKNNSLVGDGYERSNVWKMQPETTSKHSAPFPEALPDKIIKYYSYEGDIVYDPFIGSGTTAKMALLNNRKYIGSELSAEYVKIAKERIKQKTLF
jgi:DNA modification methylase